MVHRPAAELIAADLKPDPLLTKLVSARIICRGKEELAALPIGVPAELRQVCVRGLGTGSCLTEFLIAGTGAGAALARATATLGGILYTFAGAFDNLLDNCNIGVPPVTLSQNVASMAMTKPTGHPRYDLVTQLLGLYLRRLRALPQTQPRILCLIETALKRMHEAELRSVRKESAGSRSVWWRKNALLTAVMGMPAWLAHPGPVAGFTQHLAWLCRTGEFLGWVDDFADYASDCRTGNLNRIGTILRKEHGTDDRFLIPQMEDTLIGKAGRLCKRIMSEWDGRNPISPVRDTFAVMVWAWSGNPQEPQPAPG